MDLMTDNSLKSPEEQDLKSRPQESLARLEARRKLAKQIVETKQKLDKLIIEINQDMEVKKEDFAKEKDLKSRPQESFARLEARRKLAQIVETKQKLNKLIIEINQDIMEVKKKTKEDFAKEKGKRERARKVVIMFRSVAVSSLLCGLFYDNIGLPKTVIPFFVVLGCGSFGLALHFENEDLKSRPQESFARRKLAQIVETKQKLDKLIIEINQDIMEVKKKKKEDFAKEKGKRERARKVVIMFRSVAVSSLLCGLFYDNIGLPKTVIPFFVVLGCGSFGLALHFENKYLKPKKSCNPTEDEKELLSSILASVEDMEMNL